MIIIMITIITTIILMIQIITRIIKVIMRIIISYKCINDSDLNKNEINDNFHFELYYPNKIFDMNDMCL